MKIMSIGGGAAGLYFALLMKKRNPSHEVIVYERNRADDTFGWGVVFSDATLENLKSNDEKTATQILNSFNHWDDIAVHFKGETNISGGHGFCGIGRKRLLNILQARCLEVGVTLNFQSDIIDIKSLEADLIIGADGLNSRVRNTFAASYKPQIDERKCRFVWLGTRKLFKEFTFAFVETPHGWFQAHAYQYDGDTSTFIVETHEDTWLKAGLNKMSQEAGIAFCEELFKDYLDGNPLLNNAKHLRGSAIWIKFPRVTCENWVHYEGETPFVLMGDAAHTAHFSVGSGTKLALEDAIDLAALFDKYAHDKAEIPQILAEYQAIRSVEVLKIQNSARNSTEWFETVSRYENFKPKQFTYALLTRSQRISHENLRLRDKNYVENYEIWLGKEAGFPAQKPIPPMFLPFKIRNLTLKNRVLVSPMATYSAVEGVPQPFHLVHYGARSLGGAAMVFTEMTCVSPEARITHGCPGLWNDEQTQEWKKIVDFVHSQSDAKIAAQIGHAGRKGSTQLGWEAMDYPVTNGENWQVYAPSPLPYIEGVSQTPIEMTTKDMEKVLNEFVQATKNADKAGFDWVELHAAHGYLLSSFISPLTNKRQDEFGGSLANRLKFPLKVFKAMREALPVHKPMSVRISAHDWVEGGITPAESLEIAKAFKKAGADFIDCSSGQVDRREKPVWGRLFQTPFSDKIRNEAGINTIAVGSIFEADHVNSVIASGRADLCAVGRPHLANPAWVLTEAAKIGFTDLTWAKHYLAGKRQLEANMKRAQNG